MNKLGLSEHAAEKRRQYKREWNAKNRDKCREHERRYWERKILGESKPNEAGANSGEAGACNG
jgi:hypothetical protein